MHITLIAAVAENNIIGRTVGGVSSLPWRLSDDLKRFKRRTLGHAVIMGRTTYESVGAPLLGRENIVLTANPAWSAPGVTRAGSLHDALALATAFEHAHHADAEAEVFVIGGAKVYASALPHATRLDLTLVHANVDGDTRFPEVDWNRWRLVESERRPAAPPANEHACTFRVFDRAAPSR
jgi:dihydrofolate reductase